MKYNNRIADKLFLESALCADGEYMSTEDVVYWLKEQNNKIDVNISHCPLKEIDGWSVNNNGSIKHKSGKFFSIEGIQVETTCPVYRKWQQPIINQPEIGYLGIITKKINGVLHFLLQAKIEPGNTNYVQLSPTLQATRSNYTKVHKGRSPFYLDYFIDAKQEQILVDQLQSEQGGRFLHKRNRNIIIEVKDHIHVYDQFIWLTLSQIKTLINQNNLINMDTRSVIACASFGNYGLEVFDFISFLPYRSKNYEIKLELLKSSLISNNSLYTLDEIISYITNIKSMCDLKVKKVNLNNLRDWIVDDMKIYHKENKYFEVIALNVEIGNREVVKWSQPMVKPVHEGLCAFVTKKINNILHFIVQAKIESGNLDIVELAPTVQVLTGDYRNAKKGILPFLDVVLKANKDKIVFDALQSEEGGRFYKDQNRYMMVLVDKEFSEDLPDNYIWMTLNQLQTFLKFNNYLNIQLRSLISAISYI